MLNFLSQFVYALFSGIDIGFQAFFQALQLYNQVDSIKTTIISLIIGVPVGVITIVTVAVKIINRLLK